MNKNIITSTLWLVSCLTICGLGIIFKAPGPEYSGGIYYILFTILIALVSFTLCKTKKLETFELPLSVFIVGVIIVLFSEPLFENDHYRYLWEGNAFLRGENPYLNAPNSTLLDHLKFSTRGRIGFDHLTTVYPPIAIIWFGIGGLFGPEVGLRILMLFNAALVFFCFKKLAAVTRPWMLAALFPFFIKEFIQAIHIDLLAAFFFLLYLMEKKVSFKKRLVFIFFSIWIKVLGVAAIPFLIFQKRSSSTSIFKRVTLGLLVTISLPIFLDWYVGIEKLIGVKAFSIGWVWNPGFYSLLTRAFDLYDGPARELTGYFYASFIFILAMICLVKLFKEKWQLKDSFSLKFFYLIFSGLMFFTPVYNGWYAIWFVFPALLLKLNSGVLYGLFSAFSYIHYGHADYHWLGEGLTHIWFPVSIFELALRSKSKAGLKRCISLTNAEMEKY